MDAELQAFSRAAGLEADDDGIVVRFDDGRSQRVVVTGPVRGLFRAWSVVAPAGAHDIAGMKHLDLWRRNRGLDLVGFHVDGEGRVVAEAWIPETGLDTEEWALVLRHLARAADRLEMALTGQDQG